MRAAVGLRALELDLYQVNITVTAFRAPAGHRIVQVAGSDRSGGSVLMWDLDAPCAAPVVSPAAPTPQPPAPAAPPPAPPAPVDRLPPTGVDPRVAAPLGAALVLAGAGLLRASGREERLVAGQVICGVGDESDQLDRS